MEYLTLKANKLLSDNKSKKLLLDYFKHILTIIIIPLLLFNLALAILFVNSYKNESDNYTRSITEKNANYINNLFSQIDTYHKRFISNTNIDFLLRSPISANNTVGLYSPLYSVVSETQLLCDYNSCISSVLLYCVNQHYIYGLFGDTSSSFNVAQDTSWYDEYAKREANEYTVCLESDDGKYITFCRKLGNQAINPGLLIIKVSERALVDQFTLSGQIAESFKLISDISSNVLLDYSATNDGSRLSEYSVQLNSFPATFTYFYPHFLKTELIANNILLFVLFSIISVFLTIVLAYICSKRQYRSVVSVISAIENPYIYETDKGSDTLSNIINTSTDIVASNNNFEKELLDKITILKKSQIIALQTQINPHFLFNTLNMISYSILCNNENDTEAVNMISLLSDMLRYSMNTTEYTVMLDEEIRTVKSYIDILELKYDHSFDVIWNIDSNLLTTLTLKSIIQPLIENAVEHGIKLLYCSKKGKLSVAVYEKNSLLFINVTDNGVGMSAKKIDELNKQLNSDTIFNVKNIGLKNVVCRIKLLFGKKAGFNITSDSECTSVTVFHPIIKHDT